MTRRRYELSDREWSIIAPLLPNKPRGVARVDDRRVLNGILWRSARDHPGLKFPSATARRQPATTASCDGERQACGTGFSKRFRKPTTATSS